MIIQTARFTLREFTADDLSEIAAIHADENVMKYIGLGGAIGPAKSGAMLSAFMKSYAKNGFGIWACVDNETGRIAGQCGFNELPEGAGTELAYLFAKQYWGRGVATEVAGRTAEYGFAELKMNRIVALTWPANTASVRVLEKIGFEPAGNRRFYGYDFRFFTKQKDS